MPQSLGIDIGTTFITTFNQSSGQVSRVRHEGRLREKILEILNPLEDHYQCTFTGKAGRELIEAMGGIFLDETVAISYLLSSQETNPFGNEPGKIIDIGASSLSLYTIQQGRVADIARNTLCAAGTGLFLEEQAERLSLNLEMCPVLSIDKPPLIASRCTVFAKSDLIHHQQAGRSKDEMWAGLCRSLVVSAVNTLFRGEELKGKIMLIGGVTLNPEVVRWFHHLYPKVHWIITPDSQAKIAQGASRAEGTPQKKLLLNLSPDPKKFQRMPNLLLHKSHYPPIPLPIIDSNNNEIRIHKKNLPGENFSPNLPQTLSHPVLLGMDIGSTSTKLAVLDALNGEPILDIYGRTGGDPIEAARKIFDSFYQVTADLSYPDLNVQAFATTGSGRVLVGNIFGADLIVNEITAHGRGATHYARDVETIFEIGGQDAKYTRLENGYVADVNMNYVCAAGTGSFIEEQARKLGFPVEEIGTITRGIAPPVTSDRCTVFMEQDLRGLLKEGFSREEALASVLYSVIQNYLNRVVGNRKINEKKIFFQGATARNQGLVAALENLLDVEVVVSPFCHLMGAIGAALLAGEQQTGKSLSQENNNEIYNEINHNKPHSDFVGKEAIFMTVNSRTEICKLCGNFCRINYISRPNRSEFSWGYQCGRDPEEKKRKIIRGFDLYHQRQTAFQVINNLDNKKEKGTITLVHALSNYSYLPLWLHFFNRLGYRVILSGSTDSETRDHSSSLASADFCFPVKVALGHAIKALAKGHPVFMPYLIAGESDLKTAHSFFCPYVESCPAIIGSTLNRCGLTGAGMISPVLDFRRHVQELSDTLFYALKDILAVKKRAVRGAFKQALTHWNKITGDLENKGSVILRKLKDGNQPLFVLLGRPYNLHDSGLNLGIPEKIAAMGYTVIPLDMLRLDTQALSHSNYHNVFWKYGQRILAAVRMIKEHKNVFPIFLSNFNCGPDSFLLSFVEEELKGKPMLILELDEHDADGGYLTRIEAFLDVVRAYMRNKTVVHAQGLPHIFVPGRKPDLAGTVWIPPITQRGSRVYAASFRAFGYDARAMEDEDQEALILGKKYLRGGECLPMTLTLGNFLKHIKREPGKGRHILFMPTTEGPCRFGQYNLLERIVFQRMGLENVEVLSPSSVNSYQGLPEPLRRLLLHATIASDVLYKMLTRVRPYEQTHGDADEVYEKGLKSLEEVLEKREKPLKTIKKIAAKFAGINISKEKKPLVGIVGEIYLRQNVFGNGNIIAMIEANGAEAWLAPVHEWILYTAYLQSFTARGKNQTLLKKSGAWLNHFYIFKTERNYYHAAAEVLLDRMEPHMKAIVSAGAEYLPEEFQGEGILTIGRTVLFARQGADMVINVAPFGCMPGTLSSSILLEIKEKLNIPIISLFYDGDMEVNEKVAALLTTLRLDEERMDIELPGIPA